ncbi:hypothetical protein LWI28_013511 [Acer negundo]|uniref:Nodulin-like domain-containing protein n=1 Tax=Acer negundo TaxID=4023 RepID=A0AAD5ICQ0_ACENE|nr:hypothetical protein LWI28_013511 [Acer negundo]
MANFFGLKQHLLPWLVLGGVTLLQAVSGTRFIYGTCSNLMQQRYSISRAQLNNLIVASESGRLFGWFSNAAAEFLPAPMILIIGLILGSIGYGVQYLSITNQLPFLSYWQMLLLNVLAGNSICWINTYCQLVTCKIFKNNCDTITAITSCYCGLSGKIYTSLVEGIQGKSQDSSIYLLFACLGPNLFGLPVTLLNCLEVVVDEYEETKMLPFVFVIVIATGVYAVVESIAQPFRQLSPRLRVVSLVLAVLMLPLVVAFLMVANQLITLAKWDSKVMSEEEDSKTKTKRFSIGGHRIVIMENERDGNKKEANGDENWLKLVVKSVDFWLFYWMNMCGATLGMVYLNNLKIISELQSYNDAYSLLATSSSYGFFGRIFSTIFTWYTRENSVISKPGLIMFMMLPMPVVFFMLMSSNNISLYISTGIIGSSSGAISAIIGSPITSTSTSSSSSSSSSSDQVLISLSNSVVYQPVILPTNIPIGTLIFGFLAALNYQRDGHKICFWGLKCHQFTFITWGCACSIATSLSFSLYLRSRKNNLQKT